MTFVPVSLSKRQSDVSVSQNKSTILLAVNSVDMDFSTSPSIFDMDLSTSDITLSIPSFNEFFSLLLFILGPLFSAKTPFTSTLVTST